MENKKIYFLDIIRVLATISVFCSHAVFLFWKNNDVVQNLWQTPAVAYQSSWFSSFWSIFHPAKFNSGPFGVALFFLISGFMFLPSVERSKSTESFFIKKFLRLYPVYTEGVVLMMLWAYSFRTGDTFIYSWKDILVTMTLFRPLWGNIPSVDGLSWYLECLTLFYVIGYIYNKYFPLKDFKNMMLLGIIGILLRNHIAYFSIYYIFVGICFYNFYCKNYTFAQLVCSAATFVYIYYYKYHALDSKGCGAVFVNYIYALGIFCLFYVLRSKPFTEQVTKIKIFKIINNLSFPIYVVHGVCSYVIMANLYQIVPNWFVCVGAAVLWTLAAAAFIHYCVENPAKNLSKKLENIGIYEKTKKLAVRFYANVRLKIKTIDNNIAYKKGV